MSATRYTFLVTDLEAIGWLIEQGLTYERRPDDELTGLFFFEPAAESALKARRHSRVSSNERRFLKK